MTPNPESAAHSEPRRGREARRAARARTGAASIPYITRAIPMTEILTEEGLATIEANAETLLQEIGVEFRDYPTALERFRQAGADMKGARVRFPKGLAKKLCATTPSVYTQHARNPERSVQIGGKATVFAPNYGSPFVHDLDKGRRYGTIEDFRNFVKLAYLSPVHPSFRRHGLRAGRSAGQQAPSRNGLCAYALFRQAVHGLGDPSRARRRHGRDVRDPVRQGICRRQHGLHHAHQRQLAARLGFDDARRGGDLRARQSGLHHHAVHSVGRDEPGDGRRHADAGAGGSAAGTRSASWRGRARR